MQGYTLCSGDNPEHRQFVDVRGQASIRFAEGSPSMDAFGNLRIGEATAIGTYDYAYGSNEDLFQDDIANGGAATHLPTKSATELTTTTAAGSRVARTTTRYHYYQPGVSNLIMQTIAMSPGVEGNRRRWGYFDADDGIFWELEGVTLYAVIRSSVSGVVVEDRVAQASWNQDAMDGTGLSEMLLDVTKANLYFIDFAWLGVGEVRFGVIGPTGERNLVHIFGNPNSRSDPYMRSGTLPLRWENENTGAPVGGSTLKSICAAVYSQSRTDYTFWRFSDIERAAPVEVTTNTPILSMRVRAGSRIGIYPECLDVLVTGGNVKFTIVDDATLTGATWAITGGGVAEGDIAATAATGGEVFKVFYASPGVMNIDLEKFYELNDEGYHRLPDDSDSYTFTVLATKLDGATVTAMATLGYKELR